MSDEPAAPLLVVMGVSGSGKTSLGIELGRRLGVPFADADDFHSPANIAKMSAGVALDDADRLPWLRAIGEWLGGHARGGAVVTCSALKRAYRDILRESRPALTFVHVDPPAEVIRRRIAGRRGHFMPASLLDSQLRTLEPLGDDERGVVLGLDLSVEESADACLAALPRLAERPAPPVRITEAPG